MCAKLHQKDQLILLYHHKMVYNFLHQNRNGAKVILEQFWNSCTILEHRPGFSDGIFMPFYGEERQRCTPMPLPCSLR